jgi:spore maturation protein CgeB
VRIVLFAHSLVSDWSHGNAHFLRGLMRALAARGHRVRAAERADGWSVRNLVADHGTPPLAEFRQVFADIRVDSYRADGPDAEAELERVIGDAELLIVHEWTDPDVADRLHAIRARRDDLAMLFHDTHHRTVSAPDEIARLRPDRFDGVLAFGESLVEVYRERWPDVPVWCFHEAADVTTFRPLVAEPEVDVVWIGNWGDEERSAEIRAFLLDSARALPDLGFAIHGVRYPDDALREVRDAGIAFRGWLPNARVPDAFARARMTVHIPRGPYLSRLHGIPTIRPFEAMACGIPLISTPWADSEGLFRAGADYLVADDPAAMHAAIRRLAADPALRQQIAASGLETIRARHTCDHRAEQLERICGELGIATAGSTR